MGNQHGKALAKSSHTHMACGATSLREAALAAPVSTAADYLIPKVRQTTAASKGDVCPNETNEKDDVLDLAAVKVLPSLQLVGGKALKLMELSLSSGAVIVPAGCVVTSRVYHAEVVSRMGLHFDAMNVQLLEAGHTRILQEARLSVQVCEAVQKMMARHSRGVNNIKWAVRSSATLEDGTEFSMAGLAESFLFVPSDSVPEAVLKCWASLWSARVGKYFESAKITGLPLMAVIVQQMIEPRSAGVLFTIHPSAATGDVMSLEAVHGAGEALVSGKVTPSAFRIDVRNRVLTAESKKKQTLKLVQAADGGLREVPSTDDSDPLSGDEIWNLVEVGKRIAIHFGAPQDIEFVIDPDNQLHVVQTRPVTRFACLNVKGNWFSGFAFKSWLAMSLSSMTGYYLSKTTWAKTNLTEEETVRSFFGIAFVSNDLSKLVPGGAVDLELIRAYLAHLSEMEPLLWRLANGLSTVPSALLNKAVAGMLRERVELGFLSFATGAECRVLEKQLDEDLLLSVRSRPESSLHVHEMEKMAAELRKHPSSMEKLVAGRFEEFMNDPFFLRHVQAYLRQFFFHCALDEDVLETRWIDDPAIVLSMLRLHVLAPAALARASTTTTTTTAEAEGKSRKLIRFLDYMRAKDDVHEAYLRGNFFLCKMLQEVNARLNLPQNDLFFCAWRTLVEWLEGGSSAAEAKLRHEISVNKYVRESMRCWQRPCFIKRGMPGFAATSSSTAAVAREEPQEDGGRLLTDGIGGSPGVATGTCRVCNTLEEAVDVLRQGDILVTEMTSPAWTPLFSLLAGVVTEHGGRLSHAAVVARECGLPAVLGLEGACTALHSGDRIRVDGSAGTVAVLGETPPQQQREEKEQPHEEDEELIDLSQSRDELMQSRNA